MNRKWVKLVALVTVIIFFITTVGMVGFSIFSDIIP